MHELYDLEKDPFELSNLIESADYSEILAEMKQRLARNAKQSGDADVALCLQ
jgi:hypothetical protein